MSFFKVSFSSDSIEGVTSLIETPARTGTVGTTLDPLGSGPPPIAELAAMVTYGGSPSIADGSGPPPVAELMAMAGSGGTASAPEGSDPPSVAELADVAGPDGTTSAQKETSPSGKARRKKKA